MKYMFLIYVPEALRPEQRSDSENEAIMQGFVAFSEEVVRRGVAVSGDPLAPADTATTVRVREGQPLVTDGPFAETKEQLGGYYILDCKDLDEAIELAAKIPTAAFGSVEIRAIEEYSG